MMEIMYYDMQREWALRDEAPSFLLRIGSIYIGPRLPLTYTSSHHHHINTTSNTWAFQNDHIRRPLNTLILINLYNTNFIHNIHNGIQEHCYYRCKSSLLICCLQPRTNTSLGNRPNWWTSPQRTHQVRQIQHHSPLTRRIISNFPRWCQGCESRLHFCGRDRSSFWGSRCSCFHRG